ncbi:DDRGK domain-containing protein 1-like [Patiria miniata]|uniref:DDRGK domain-containing protein 1 n=1 Tax=Patiria miniata TaxID=46514 RepID=A0A914ALQ9_PATMI|nr:DDRGK domain-containing protein 1-like [Patiria miniata]
MDGSDRNVYLSSAKTDFLVPAILVAFAVIIASIICFVSKLNHSVAERRDRPHVQEARQRDEDEAVVRAPARRARAARNRMMRQAVRQEELEEDEQQLQEEIDYETGVTKKIGAKKARKLEMKAEKQAQREQELAEREERKRRQEIIDAQRQLEADKEKQEQSLKEEEAAKLKEESEKQEEEAYLLLKENFEVHEEGFDKVLTESESQNLLQEFINYIKLKKVVLLEDLGGEFNMKTQEAIHRVQDLQDQGLLTGVIDDRGKFIFISQEELEGVAKFMQQRGRVSISDLAEASNTLVFLNTENDPTFQQGIVA